MRVRFVIDGSVGQLPVSVCVRLSVCLSVDFSSRVVTTAGACTFITIAVSTQATAADASR